METASRPDYELTAARFALLSRLADDLAHEVKNPLHAMVINLEVLRRRVASSDAAGALERAAVVEHEIRRVHDIVDQLLRLLRPDPEGEAPVEPDDVLAEIVPLLDLRARLARVPFQYLPCGPGCPVRSPPAALKFAVLHLTEPLIRDAAARGAGIAMTGSADAADVTLRIVARDGRPGQETESAAPGTPSSEAGPRLDLARRLLADVGGRVTRDPVTDPAVTHSFTIVLPRSAMLDPSSGGGIP